jgi:hypothetical protein
MRFLISVFDTASNSGTEMLQEHGHWIFACGLAAPSTATTIDNRDDAGLTNAGPVNNTTEFQSGFWIISAESREQAEALAAQGSKACNRKVEVRTLLGS